MKILLLFISFLFLTGCIQTDFEPEVESILRISSTTKTIVENESFTFTAQYINTKAREEEVTVVWESKNSEVIRIDASLGKALALKEGTTIVFVGFGGLKDSVEVSVVMGDKVVTTQPAERQVNLQGSGGYTISGTGVLKEDSEDNLILELKGVVVEGPGPYFYLSNRSKNISNGINLGKSTNGDFEFNITSIDPNATINSYDYLVVWCKPFGITLGFGQFDN